MGVVGRASFLRVLTVCVITFHSIPFRAVFRRSEPGHVAREIVVVSVGSVWLYAVVFPSLGWSSCFRCPFLLGWSEETH